jgi:hypothetical protein
MISQSSGCNKSKRKDVGGKQHPKPTVNIKEKDAQQGTACPVRLKHAGKYFELPMRG